MLLRVIMRSRGPSNRKEMNAVAADVFDLHIRGRASAAFTLSCLLENRNMFYKIGNREWGGGGGETGCRARAAEVPCGG